MNNGNKSFKQAKVGRPNKGYEKHIMRSVVSDLTIEEYLKEHPDVNASEVFRLAVYSLMPKGDTKIRLDRLEKEIKDKKINIRIKELEAQELRNKIEFEESIKLDIRLEEDCGAWYLRDLIVKKKLSVYFSPFHKRNILAEDSSEMMRKHHLMLNLDSFVEKSEIENERMKIMPVEWYKQFKPIFTLPELKETIKNRMRPEYLKQEVRVEMIPKEEEQ